MTERASSTRPSTWAVLRSALRLIHAAGKRQLYTIIAATVVTSIAVAGQLLIGRNLLDLLTDDDHVSARELGPYILALGVLLMVSAVAQSIANELRIPLSESVYRRTMDDILDVATEVEIEVYETSDFHDRLERAVAASLGRVSAIVFGVVALISTLIVAAGVVVVLMTVAPLLVPIAVLGYLPIAFVNARNNRARHRLEVEMIEVQRNRYYLEDLMTSRNEAKELRAYDIAPTLRRWHAALWDTRMERLSTLVRSRLRLTTVGSAVTNAVLVVTLAFAFILAGRGSISVGDAAIAIVGLQQLSSRLQSSGAAFSGIHDGMIYLRDFEEFRATLPEMRRLQPVGVPPAPPTVVRLEHVGYRYPGSADDAVHDVSLELRTGQILAIVGANGSGKTTLSKLVCQLLPPTRGAIFWDDIDLATCDRAMVRSQIAPVFQDYAQYQLTFRQSIGLGDVRRIGDDSALTDAARRAGILDVIEAQPAGLDTRLGKGFSGGIDMSIGQWQRLAIARALLRDAPIMVLDEPSASLDPRGEAELFDLLHRAFADRLVMFVSHRFATVRSADLILVMDQGDVVEIGDHNALIAAGGLYSELFNLQAQRYGLGA